MFFILEQYKKELIALADSHHLIPYDFDIQFSSPSRMRELQSRGYAKRPYKIPDSNESFYIAELYDFIGVNRLYLNEYNNHSLNLLAIAHAIGHADFIKHNKWINQRAFRLNQIIEHGNDIDFYETDKLNFINKLLTLSKHIMMTEEFANQYINKRDGINLIDYLLHEEFPLKTWEKTLLRLIRSEALVFEMTYRTKIMNEGWACYYQMPLLKSSSIDQDELLRIIINESELYRHYRYGINPYTLGKSIWSEVPDVLKRQVMKNFTDYEFIQKYYTEAVHNQEQISIIDGDLLVDEFHKVKANLLKSAALGDQVVLTVDQQLTSPPNELVLRHTPKSSNPHSLKTIKTLLQSLLNMKVYLKASRLQKSTITNYS
ncbi:SpoVR family protein [Alkalibacillus aidingensis]|uniref:SpoVR family protein n=1 Tax=Alkalibacillus aidingensis TaxID=2747607 RepID=UPI0016615F35|nr:SpoVR family protein [Alkalibacillus aidingensis]